MRQLKNLTLSSQIFLFISSFVLLLIFLQFLIYQFVFQGFYLNQQLNILNDTVTSYVVELRNNTSGNYFSSLYNFTTTNNAITLILDEDFVPIEDQFENYSVEVTDTLTYDVYTIVLPETSTVLRLSDRIRADIQPRNTLDDTYDIYSLTLNNELQYEIPCDDCIEVNGVVTAINAPRTLNLYFRQNQTAITELFRIRTSEQIKTTNLDSVGIRLINDTDFSRNIVYLNKINTNSFLLTIFVTESPEDITNILGAYNFTIYLVIIVLAIAMSIVISKFLSTPITKIDAAAKEISNLNFDVVVQESQNVEVSSLSKSMNTIAVNLKETIQKLNSRNAEVTRLYEDQLDQIELRKKFISAISHELKTPLMVMNITAQGILDGIFDTDEQPAELEKLLAEITTLDSMIKDLLDVYKLDELRIDVDLEKINLKTITERQLENVDSLITRYNHQVEFEADRNTSINANPKFMGMVISNILTNAIKYTPNGNKIKITIASIKDFIEFRVTNYGVTIPEDQLAHIWEPFFRIDQSRTKNTKAKGTGLGLYIVAETLKAHRFNYGIENLNGGVSVWFRAKKNRKD
jgi:two-component system, OmpR family, sensor histidine kinase VanS